MRLQRIEVKKDGQYVSIMPEEFLALPLADRLGFILQRGIRFYDADGKTIPLQEGGRILREREVDAAPRAPAPPAPAPTPVEGNGKWRVSLLVFLQLPLDLRLPMLVDRRVIFRDGRGDEIPFKEGLRIMRAIQASGVVAAEHEGASVEART
jgi:hypothetical protein